MVADHWFMQIEKVLEAVKITTDATRIRLAAFQLEGESPVVLGPCRTTRRCDRAQVPWKGAPEKVSLIRQRLLTAQSRKKSYADVQRRPLEFEVGDHVFLKVMPKRGVVRFDKRGKLSPRFIGPFEILERVGTVAYQLALPPSMLGVHEVFHVSMLQKYTPDPAHVVDWGQIEVDTDGTFEEGPVCIVDSLDQVLRRKTVRLVKVLWMHYGVEESTREHEDTMRATYPFLFRDEST